jgi:hypothetical protein
MTIKLEPNEKDDTCTCGHLFSQHYELEDENLYGQMYLHSFPCDMSLVEGGCECRDFERKRREG